MDFNQFLNNSLGSSINFSKIKKYILIASGILLFLFVLFIVLLFLFFSHILNFVTSYIPVVSEFLFTYAKDFYMGYFQEDLLALVQPFTNGVNGAELKSIIDNYVQNVLNSQNFSLFYQPILARKLLFIGGMHEKICFNYSCLSSSFCYFSKGRI